MSDDAEPTPQPEPVRYRRLDFDAADRRRRVVRLVVLAVVLGGLTGVLVPVDGESALPKIARRLGWQPRWPAVPWEQRAIDPAVAEAVRRRGLRPPPTPARILDGAVDLGLPFAPADAGLPGSVTRLLGPMDSSLPGWLRDGRLDPRLRPRPIEPLARLAHVPVMMYHDVVDGPKDVSFDITLEQFESDLAKIEAAGATPISLRQWWGYITRGDPLPAKPILLTFDDGYKSVYTLIYPRLKQRGWPAVFFIIPPYVGVGPHTEWFRGSKDHVTWDEMAEMRETGLFEFQCHAMTSTRLSTISSDKIDYEVFESQRILQAKLGVPIQFFCYPIGDRDERVIATLKRAGFVAAFTMETGGSAQSSSIMETQRYDSTLIDLALAASSGTVALAAPPMHPKADLTQPITFRRALVPTADGELPLCWVTGGSPTTVHADYRYGVPDTARAAGLPAGINGGFFGMASIYGTANSMIGPVMASLGTTRDETVWETEQVAEPAEVFASPRFVAGSEVETGRLGERPLVLMSATDIRFVPFEPMSMNSRRAMELLLPGVTDVFVAGAWLVRDGRPLSRAEQDRYATRDHHDPRRRAFFGIDAAGRPVIGATAGSYSSERVGEALAALGVYHAVLLDSGFSSSLYYNGNIFVTGHSDEKPSRPVPHMILLRAPDSAASRVLGQAAGHLSSLGRWARGDDQADYLPPMTRLVDTDDDADGRRP